jgi:hypothetical protein
VHALSTNLGFDLGKNPVGRWEKAERTDLLALLGTNFDRQNKAVPTATPRPTNQQQAAAAILDIFRQTYDPVLDELRAASQKPRCRFDLDYDCAPLPGIVLEHLAPLKGIVIKTSWRAEAELALGRSREAFEDLMLGLHMSDTVRGEPFLISHLVQLACHAIMTRVIWEGLADHQWSEPQLQRLQAALASNDFLGDTRHALEGERSGFGVRTVEQIMGRQGGVYLDMLLETKWQGRLAHWVMPRGWFYFEMINICRGFELNLAPYPEWRAGRLDTRGFLSALEQENELLKDLKPWKAFFEHRLLVGLMLPATGRAWHKSLMAQARSDLAGTACALERCRLADGQYPETLAALVPRFTQKVPTDIMSGQPLIYRREGPQAYVLYSVGKNLVDDGGRVVCKKTGVVNYDEGDWVWRQPER